MPKYSVVSRVSELAPAHVSTYMMPPSGVPAPRSMLSSVLGVESIVCAAHTTGPANTVGAPSDTARAPMKPVGPTDEPDRPGTTAHAAFGVNEGVALKLPVGVPVPLRDRLAVGDGVEVTEGGREGETVGVGVEVELGGTHGYVAESTYAPLEGEIASRMMYAYRFASCGRSRRLCPLPHPPESAMTHCSNAALLGQPYPITTEVLMVVDALHVSIRSVAFSARPAPTSMPQMCFPVVVRRPGAVPAMHVAPNSVGAPAGSATTVVCASPGLPAVESVSHPWNPTGV